MFATLDEAIASIFRTRDAVKDQLVGSDERTRDISPTRNLLLATGLLTAPREYAVVTGSKGKGSVTSITMSLLRALGHTVGTLTSPHLVHWTERIRVNGEAIPEADFLRILGDLQPTIDREAQTLTGNRYISPQGIFLLIALRYFQERNVNVAIMEVGRGGRYDDVSLVPNKVSVFTPIFLEHVRQLGDTVERIAWHKAGIIKEGSYAYSVAQPPPVLDVLQRECDAKHAEFFWFSALDRGEWVADTPNGMIARLGRYGECELPFLGRYQIDNATLAIQTAGNLHARLFSPISHGSAAYVQAIREGLRTAKWHGRLQKLGEQPQIFVEGAINALSVDDLLTSLKDRTTRPIVVISAVPIDRDRENVYRRLANVADALILTESHANPSIHFPPPAEATQSAKRYHKEVSYAPTLTEALAHAKQRAGQDGTVIMAVAQPLVGEAMMLWGIDPRHI